MFVFDRKTVRCDVTFDGLGLHSGTPVKVAVHPGSSGIRFLNGTQVVIAHPDNVTDVSRCTTLGGISTVEHLMSALAGCEITDADIELSEPELPALDGAAGVFCQEILKTGTEKLGQAKLNGPFARVFVHEKDSKIAVAAGNGHWKFEYNTGDRWPHSQVYETTSIQVDFIHQLAPSRTFGLEEEIPVIQAAGLAKGLDMSTALILGQEDYLNTPLFDLEPARHKLLDLVGDLYLTGIPIRFLNVAAERGGHWVNVKAAKVLAANTKIERA